MSTAPDENSLKRVLDVADRLGRLRQRLSERDETDHRAGRTVRAESRRAVRAVTSDLDQGIVPGMLGLLHQRHRFDDDQLTIVLLLLERRIHEAQQTLTGREILAFLHEGSFERLRGLRHLAEDGLLRRSGILEVDAGSAARDLLDAEIRLSEAVFRAIEKDVTPEIDPPRKKPGRLRRRAYSDQREHLLDMARLSRLYQRRARRVFESEEPEETLSRSAVKRIEIEIGRLRGRIAARLRATSGSEGFPLVEIRRRYRLDDAEELILVTLLFQEIYAGASYIETIELVKMVSASDLELMDRRLLLSPDGRLVTSGLVQIATADEQHQLGGEAFIPPDLVRKLLMVSAPAGPIDADARLEWHEYLDSLEDSDDFFNSI